MLQKQNMENLDQILSHEYSQINQCHLGDQNYDKSTNQNNLFMITHQNHHPSLQNSPKQNMFFFSLNSPLQNYDKFQFSHPYDRQDKNSYKQISRKISYQQQNSADINSQDLQAKKQQKKQPIQSHTKFSKRNIKGLKNLSLKVFEIVSEQGVSSYIEVAERLVEQVGNHQNLNFKIQQNGSINKDQHNIKRRVYDALNVLIAAQLLRKQGKKVICNYKFQIGQNCVLINLRAERDKNKSQMRKKKALLQQKKKKLKLLEAKKQAIKHVLNRNRQIQGSVKNSQKITIPFIVVQAATSSLLKIIHNRKEAKINIDQNFQIFGDADILLQVQNCLQKQDNYMQE